jgi:hypothetical protein
MVLAAELCGNVDMSRFFCALKRRFVDRMWIFLPLIHQNRTVFLSCPQSYPQKFPLFFAGKRRNLWLEYLFCMSILIPIIYFLVLQYIFQDNSVAADSRKALCKSAVAVKELGA